MKSNLIKGIIVALFWISTIVTINASDSCDKAEKLNANVSGANVSLTWSGKSTSYVIEVENKTTNQVVVPESNAASPFVLTLANGSYKFKVRSICAKTKSDWSDWFNFNVNNVSTPPATTPAGGNGSDGGTSPGQSGDDFPMAAGSWGGIVRAGPGREYAKVGSLAEGERITLLKNTGVVTNDYPWFRIRFRGNREGYQWGGIICGLEGLIDGAFETCP